jgi:glutathione S-transferase
MDSVTVYGFQRSTYVNIVRLVLTHKGVPFAFRDLEPDMGSASHMALHPFGRVPILEHDGFRIYETSAIVGYLDEAFPTPALQPTRIRERARMQQWISAVNAYYYPYMIYHVVHERLVFPDLGIPADEKVVAHALPRVQRGLELIDKELAHGGEFLLGAQLTLADFFLLPSVHAFSLTGEGQAMLPKYRAVVAWSTRMEALPSVRMLRTSLPPRVPIEHARQWAVSHRPKY